MLQDNPCYLHRVLVGESNIGGGGDVERQRVWGIALKQRPEDSTAFQQNCLYACIVLCAFLEGVSGMSESAHVHACACVWARAHARICTRAHEFCESACMRAITQICTRPAGSKRVVYGA